MSSSCLLLVGVFLSGWAQGGMIPTNQSVWKAEASLISDSAGAVFSKPKEGESVERLQGEAAYRRLKQSVGPAGMVWKGTPLREVLEGLAQSSRIAFILDRRVDPGQPVDLLIEKGSLLEAFVRIAQDRGLGICLVGPVVYLGPPAAAERLNTLIAMAEEHLQTLPNEMQKRFLEESPLSWPDLTSPRDILADLAASAGVSVVHGDRLPHDLWAKGSLPPLSLTRRLCLVLHQFDLSFQVQAEGQELALIPLPERIALVRSYPAGGNLQQRVQQIAQAAPEAEIRLRGDKIWVRGRLEDHHRIALALDPTGKSSDLFGELERLLKGPTASPAKPAKSSSPSRPASIEQVRVDSLRIRNKPLGEVLDLLGQRLGLEFRIDEATLRKAGVSLDRQISLEVQQASVDELLEKIFQPLGLRVQRRQHVVEVRP